MATYYVKTSGNDTTGDGSSGNPWATPGKAGGSLAGDDILYIEEGTYSITSTTANIAGGRLSLPANVACTVIGHATGDITDFSAKPLLTAGVGSLTVISIDGNDGENQVIFNVKVSGEKRLSTTGISGTNANWEFAINCEAVDCTTRCFSTISCFGCKSSYDGTKTGVGFNLCFMSECWADNHATGVESAGTIFSNCIISNCTNGVSATNGYRNRFYNCVSYGNTNSGFETRNAPTLSGSVFVNCIAYGNGAYGWDFNVVTGSGLINCASGNNTSGRTDGNETFDLGVITLTADPFTNAAGGDFSLNNTVGGGALLRSLGYGIPGQTQNIDIGAVQHEDTIGGGGAVIINYGITQSGIRSF